MAVAIIGAGPAGLAAAYQLTKKGTFVEVFEASSSPGGLAKTIELWGQRVDIGPHRFFSNDRRVNELWLEVVGHDYRMVDRLTRILYHNRLFHYPLKPLDALAKLGPVHATQCLASYLKERICPTHDDGTFESWVTRRFGRELFKVFFESYSEKLWGISCKDLDSDFAAQRIKKLSLFEAIKNAVLPKGVSQHKTLVDRFAYPLGGTGMVYKRMAKAVEQRGGSIHYKSPVHRVLVQNARAIGIELTNGRKKHFDHIISTMPITLLVDRMDCVPDDVRKSASSLKFRNTVLVYINVAAKDLFPDNWIYVHSPDLRTGRITNFRNWIPELYGECNTTILAMEYWCYDEDPLWTQDEAATIKMAAAELRGSGLIGTAHVLDGKIYPIKRCYPVYERNYKMRLKPVQEYLSSIQNLSVIGRYGAFKYNNQDHSILMGIFAAENIHCGYDQHNLWEINSDYENYQERSLITEDGLQMSPG